MKRLDLKAWDRFGYKMMSVCAVELGPWSMVWDQLRDTVEVRVDRLAIRGMDGSLEIFYARKTD